MDPKLFTSCCLVVYGLFTTLGCYELEQAIVEDYLRGLFICLFIVNGFYTLVMMGAAYSSFISKDKSHIISASIVFGIMKVVLASVAVNALRKDSRIPERVITLCVVEIVLIFGPIFVALVITALVVLIQVTCFIVDYDNGSWRWASYAMWGYIILSLVLGGFEVVQASEEDYLRTMFILFAVSNLSLPIVNIVIAFVCYSGREDDGFIFFLSVVGKIVLASFALYAMVNESNIPFKAKVLCYIEIVHVFAPIAIIVLVVGMSGLVFIGMSFRILFNFCYQFHTNPPKPNENPSAHQQGEISQYMEEGTEPSHMEEEGVSQNETINNL
jgi:hypothetical protein